MRKFNRGVYLGGRELFMLLIVPLLYLKTPEPPKQEADTKSPGNMIVSIAWPEGSVDVDLWVRGPDEDVVGYSRRSGKLFNLLRDDLGTTNDNMPTLNYENAYSRGLPPGEYTVNLHCYSCGRGNEKVEVEIRLGVKEPYLFLDETIELAPRQERTVIRFKLDDKGFVVPGSVNRVFIPLRASK